MATSGSKDFSITRGEIIGAALRKIGAYDQAESVHGEDDSDAAFALNILAKEWSAYGLDVWLRKEIIVFLEKDQQSYQLGLTSPDGATTDTIRETALLGNMIGVSSVASVEPDGTVGMSVGDVVGIKLDDGTIHWSTLLTVTTTQIIMVTGIPLGTTAAVGNEIYSFATSTVRPQRLLYINRRDTNNIDTEIDLIGESEYRLLSTKGSAGPPNQAYYKPTLDNGTLYVWPVDAGATWDRLVIQAQFPVDDFDSTADEPEFPIEWGNALIWQLAHDIAPEYGVEPNIQARLFAIATKKLNDLLDYDQENANVVFSLDGRAGRA